MTQKRLLSTGAALLAALCLLLALSGCGGEKPLLDQPIKTLTCVEPTALPTLVPLGDGRVLAGWVLIPLCSTIIRSEPCISNRSRLPNSF